MKIKHNITLQTNCKLILPMLSAVITVLFFGCQKKETKKQEIKSLEVAADSSTTKSDSSDHNLTKKTLEQSQSSSLKVKQLKFKKTVPSSDVTSKNNDSQSDKAKKGDAALASKPPVNTNAEFPGGIEQFHNFFMKEYKKPEDVSYWKLNFTLAFAVEKNGSVSFLECSPAVEEPLQKEIIRVLSLCPKWQPGESNGKKVRMQYSVPILLK